MIKNEIDKDIKYRLYRTVKELLHPTISKKNISEYKIIIREDLLPIYVYYPKKVSNIDRVLIYIHGDSRITECTNYSLICSNLAIKTDSIVMTIDYKKINNDYEKNYHEIYDVVKHIYKELNDISTSLKIALVGDSTGCNIINGINYLNKDEINISEEIFFYPVLNTKKSIVSLEKGFFNPNLLIDIENYFKEIIKEKDITSELLNYTGNIPKTLIVIGNVDPLCDSVKEYSNNNRKIKYVEIPFVAHGFLKNPDKETEKELYEAINKFLNN